MPVETPDNATTSDPPLPFKRKATAVLARLQTSMRRMIEATPGRVGRPAELAETLGVSSKLAWQAYRVAHAPDPLAAASKLPGQAAMAGLLDAAARRGTPPGRIAEVQSALRELRELMRKHAGSRGEFDTMISGLTPDGAEQVDLVHKRAAFKAQSHLLGVQARTHLGCFIYSPTQGASDLLDCAVIRGLIGLRRFRHDATCIISQTRALHVDGARRPAASEPLDPTVDPALGMSLLPAFCSQPLPRIRHVPTGLKGMTNIEIVGNGIGNTAAVTCLVGDVMRGASCVRRQGDNRVHISNVRVRTPCEALVQDMLMHRAVGLREPKLSIYSDHNHVDVQLEWQMELRAPDRVPLRESIVYLGRGVERLATEDVPRYVELMRFALDRLGWNEDDFDIYRCRIEFPMMPSSVVMHFDL